MLGLILGWWMTNVFHLPFLCIFVFGDVIHIKYLRGQESVRRTNGTGAIVFGGWGTLSGSLSDVLTTAAARARNHKHGGRDTAPGLGVIKRKPFQRPLLEHSGAGSTQDLAEGTEAMVAGSWIQL